MAHKYGDRIKETTTTTGTGNISLGGAVSQFFAFSSVMANGDTCEYFIEGGGQSEYGIGTFVSSGNQLARTQVLGGSSGTSAVNLSAGTKMVGIAPLASRYAGLMFPFGTPTVASNAAAYALTGIPADTRILRIEFYNVRVATDGSGLVLNTSTNNGSSYDTGEEDYRGVLQEVNKFGNGVVATAGFETSAITLASALSDSTSYLSSGEIEIFNPGVAQRCQVRWGVRFYSPDGATALASGHAYRGTLADVDAVRIMATSGNLYGTFVPRIMR